MPDKNVQEVKLLKKDIQIPSFVFYALWSIISSVLFLAAFSILNIYLLILFYVIFGLLVPLWLIIKKYRWRIGILAALALAIPFLFMYHVLSNMWNP